MTIFPQLALILYLAYFQTIKYPVDSILGSFQFIFAVRCLICPDKTLSVMSVFLVVPLSSDTRGRLCLGSHERRD